MLSRTAEAIGARVAGEQASRPRALLTAATAGIAAAVLTYLFLRHEPADD